MPRLCLIIAAKECVDAVSFCNDCTTRFSYRYRAQSCTGANDREENVQSVAPSMAVFAALRFLLRVCMFVAPVARVGVCASGLVTEA